MINKDLDLIFKIRAERQLVLDNKEQPDRDRESILSLKQAAEEKVQIIIETSKRAQEKVLAEAVGERDTAERAYQELVETSRCIEQMIRGNQSASSDQAVVRVLCHGPAEGFHHCHFGWRTHPIFGTQRYQAVLILELTMVMLC